MVSFLHKKLMTDAEHFFQSFYLVIFLSKYISAKILGKLKVPPLRRNFVVRPTLVTFSYAYD